MKGYVDVFLLKILKKNLSAYKRLAQKFAHVIKRLGALEYREWAGDDYKAPFCADFPRLVKLKSNEVIITSVVEYRSKSHRDAVNKKAKDDPEMTALMPKKPIFDMKKMYYGGFKTIVKM